MSHTKKQNTQASSLNKRSIRKRHENRVKQQFLTNLAHKLWKKVNNLWSDCDLQTYKHVVLRLIFLRYLCAEFDSRKEQLIFLFEHDQDWCEDDIEDQFNYQEEGVLYIPHLARWDALLEKAAGAVIERFGKGETGKSLDVIALSAMIESALFQIEKSNVIENRFVGIYRFHKEYEVLNKSSKKISCPVVIEALQGNEVLKSNQSDVFCQIYNYFVGQVLDGSEGNVGDQEKVLGFFRKTSKYKQDDSLLVSLVKIFSNERLVRSKHKGNILNLNNKEIFSYVYEYFLEQFACKQSLHDKQNNTAKSAFTLIVEMLQPYAGRIYDPAMGDGGFFRAIDEFVLRHAEQQEYEVHKQRKYIFLLGQENDCFTLQQATMSLLIRDLYFDFSRPEDNRSLRDSTASLRADFIMSCPPVNMSERPSENKIDNVHCSFAWMQHMLHHLSPSGSLAVVLDASLMNSRNECDRNIRKGLVEEDLIECLVALPEYLISNYNAPACILFLTKYKLNGTSYKKIKRDRQGECLFIDARQLGSERKGLMQELTDTDIAQVTKIFHTWQYGRGYGNIAGFCKSVSLEDIAKHGFDLEPGPYV